MALNPPDTVREQYEAYPYPERAPEDEKQRLLTTWPEQLAQINHYCFRGRCDFRSGFRVLVAGGGTGDATIFLAEQLADTGAQLVYLDVSSASLDIARRRAEVRGLANVRFVQGSLLDLPALGLEPFDYISCTGVLHHLEDPEAGLDSLLAVLKPEGALNLLLYGTYGRAAIYQVQDLMRRIAREGETMGDKLQRLKTVLRSLPADHAWRRHRLYRDPASIEDAELFDLFLHSQDRAYTVPEIHEWMSVRRGLHLQFSRINGGPIGYRPEIYGTGPESAKLPPHERAALAERLAGNIDLHVFFATRHADAAARPEDLDNVPFFCGGFEDTSGARLAALMLANPGSPLQCTDSRSGLVARVFPGKHARPLFAQLDGNCSLREMFARARQAEASLAGASEAELLEDFRRIYDVFSSVDGMLLRHETVPRFPSSTELSLRADHWQQPA